MYRSTEPYYTGHPYDGSLNIYFAENRFYDAETGTWLSPDPIKDGLNWYVYCEGNPTTFIDILGLMTLESDGNNNSYYVTILQKSLEAMGFLDMGGEKYGTYGGKTKAAMALFELNYGLEIDGKANSGEFLTVYNAYLNDTSSRTSSDRIEAENEYLNMLKSVANYDKEIKDYRNYYPLFSCSISKHVEITSDMKEHSITVKLIDGIYYYDYTTLVNKKIQEDLHLFQQNAITYTVQDLVNMGIPLNYAINSYTTNLIAKSAFFSSQVGETMRWDLKVEESWRKTLEITPYGGAFKFIYNGEVVNAENLGNITYGYFGTAMNFSDKTLYLAGAFVNNPFGVNLDSSTYGEDASDHYYVKKGIEMFLNEYPHTNAVH